MHTQTTPAQAAAPAATPVPFDLLERIARQHLHVETLRSRNEDGLDFYDTSVFSMQAALEAAYRAGMQAAK